MFKTFGERIVVEPYYEGHDTKIGSIIIPDSMADSQPSQGVVIAAPDKYLHLTQRYVLFHRFRETAWHDGLLMLEEKDLVCYLNNGEIELLPHREEVLILPDWESKYRQPSELVYLPPVALEHNQPVIQGTVVDYSLGATNYLIPGEKVAMEPDKGSEVAVKNTLYYIIPTEHILAIIHG
jgi:co-chaperonin GroES (HSP10)